jgi:hypothetical protein
MTMSQVLVKRDLQATLPRAQDLYSVGPHNAAHRVAIRAALSMAVPLLALWVTGHTQWVLYAAFGAFTSLYGRQLAHLPRMRMQATAGAAITLAVTVGVVLSACPDGRWLSVFAVAACAMLASLAGHRLSWHPAGPLFVVFGSAALAAFPSAPAQIPVALGVAAGSAAIAVIIGGIGSLRRSARSQAARNEAHQDTPAASSWISASARAEALRYGVAVLGGGLAAAATGIGHPYWSMVAAVVAVTGTDTTARLTRSVHRIAGTFLGVFVAAALLAPHLPVPAVIGIVAVLQAGAEMFVGRNYALAVIFITPLALMMGGLVRATGEWTLLHDRMIETVLGAVIGIAVTILSHRGKPAAARAD